MPGTASPAPSFDKLPASVHQVKLHSMYPMQLEPHTCCLTPTFWCIQAFVAGTQLPSAARSVWAMGLNPLCCCLQLRSGSTRVTVEACGLCLTWMRYGATVTQSCGPGDRPQDEEPLSRAL